MALPEVIIKILSAGTPRQQPTSTAAAFDVHASTRGPALAPRLCKSMNEVLSYFGARIAATGNLWDWAETYFAEGGSELWVQRVWSSTAKAAKKELKNASAEVVLNVFAGQQGEEDPGTWGEAVEVAVTEPTTGKFKLVVYEGSTVLEESPEFSATAEAIVWAREEARYIYLTAGANTTTIPAVIAKAKLAGASNGSALVTADYEAALARIPKELGPGQVSAGGQTSEAIQKALLAHAVANNRFALLDGTNTPTQATLVAQAQALYPAASHGRRFGQLFAPWEIIPGLTTEATREVPPSARAAAQYAKVDAMGNPNRGAAGARGTAQYVNELTQPGWTVSEREALNNAGVTVSRRRFGGAIVTSGIRTLGSQSEEASWSFAPNVRTIMWFAAQAEVAGYSVEYDQVDGFGHTQSKLEGVLVGVAQKLFSMGALYGKTASEAFAVNVGESLNPRKSLEEGKLVASAALKVSPDDEQVQINIVKVPVGVGIEG